MEITEKYVCPHCGGHEFVIGKNTIDGRIYFTNEKGEDASHDVLHIACVTCNSVVRSQVQRKPFCHCQLCLKYNA